MDEFLAQLRDLTLADLTLGQEDWKARGLKGVGLNGESLVFNQDRWPPYLQALYRTLPRPTVTPGYLDLSFVAWEQNLPAERVIPNAKGPRGSQVTIQDRSQLDAVTYGYPLIIPSRYLALFSQYHAATGQRLDTSTCSLDTSTWSWMFGIIDPTRFPDWPSVSACWDTDGLNLYRNAPGGQLARSRLRSSR